MQWKDYPEIFKCADAAATRFQRKFLGLVALEFTLLVTAAATVTKLPKAPFSLIFVALVIVVLVRFLSKPQQDWYACRALAESIKTMCWRYAMRADQMGLTDPCEAERQFREQLMEVVAANRIIAEKVTEPCAGDDEIPDEMDRIRQLPLEERKKMYLEQRIGEQRSWYVAKARLNRRRGRQFAAAAVFVYIIAGTITLARPDPAVDPEGAYWMIWATEPLIVLGASVLGWMELRNFEALAAAYAVTALEIGMISPRLKDVQTEDQFANFVTDAELAFSREHTMWIARNFGLPSQGKS